MGRDSQFLANLEKKNVSTTGSAGETAWRAAFDLVETFDQLLFDSFPRDRFLLDRKAWLFPGGPSQSACPDDPINS